MKKRVVLFTFTFIIFNVLVILGRELPGLVHGRFSLAQESHSLTQWVQFIGDSLIYYLLALGIYLVACRYHPQKKYGPILVFLLFLCIATFFSGVFWTSLFTESVESLLPASDHSYKYSGFLCNGVFPSEVCPV